MAAADGEGGTTAHAVGRGSRETDNTHSAYASVHEQRLVRPLAHTPAPRSSAWCAGIRLLRPERTASAAPVAPTLLPPPAHLPVLCSRLRFVLSLPPCACVPVRLPSLTKRQGPARSALCVTRRPAGPKTKRPGLQPANLGRASKQISPSAPEPGATDGTGRRGGLRPPHCARCFGPSLRAPSHHPSTRTECTPRNDTGKCTNTIHLAPAVPPPPRVHVALPAISPTGLRHVRPRHAGCHCHCHGRSGWSSRADRRSSRPSHPGPSIPLLRESSPRRRVCSSHVVQCQWPPRRRACRSTPTVACTSHGTQQREGRQFRTADTIGRQSVKHAGTL
jgi:hypothetical protein